MRKFLAALVAAAGLALGAYLAIWVLLAGGIREIVDAVQHHPVPSGPVVAGILKLAFFEAGFVVTWLAFLLAAFIRALDSPRRGLR